MNSKHYHTPLSTRVRCPVCHEAVYSRAGIHPQCAVRQADPPRPKAKPPKSGDPAGAGAVDVAVVEIDPALALDVDPVVVEGLAASDHSTV
jgi:hypothetical protein